MLRIFWKLLILGPHTILSNDNVINHFISHARVNIQPRQKTANAISCHRYTWVACCVVRMNGVSMRFEVCPQGNTTSWLQTCPAEQPLVASSVRRGRRKLAMPIVISSSTEVGLLLNLPCI